MLGQRVVLSIGQKPQEETIKGLGFADVMVNRIPVEFLDKRIVSRDGLSTETIGV
jgi:hypothetical protein